MSIWWGQGGVMHVWRQGIYGNSFSSPSGNLMIQVLRHFAIVLQVPEALFILKFQFSFSLFRLSHWYCPILQFSDSLLCFFHPIVDFITKFLFQLYFLVLKFPPDSPLYCWPRHLIICCWYIFIGFFVCNCLLKHFYDDSFVK